MAAPGTKVCVSMSVLDAELIVNGLARDCHGCGDLCSCVIEDHSAASNDHKVR